ncbi:hypothetical protein GCM10025868_20490 [Angustibacter aerolatus]|uniref:Uncharacterized protein n=1 Tax=Angustibacter aerolatus TaxID=1162965 RepID=A0ABQ6JHF6_9ACTN|nr:hypothetical protein GCM10025868_20490 [Angustibacter aerolatus]
MLRDLLLDAVEDRLRQTAGVGLGLHHQRRHGRDEHGLRHPRLAVPRQVAHHLAATGRVPDVHGVVQVEVLGERGQVVGVVVHVVAVGGLARPAVAAPVVRHDPVALLQEEQQAARPSRRTTTASRG